MTQSRPAVRSALRQVVRAFDLSPLDLDLLIVAVAPDLDPRYEKVFGYLNDDVTRRRPSVALALTLCGADLLDGAAGAVWVRKDLWCMASWWWSTIPTARFLPGALRVPDRIVSHLLGDDTPDQAIDPYLVEWVDADVGRSDGIGRAIAGAEPGSSMSGNRTGRRPAPISPTLSRAAGRAVVSLDLNCSMRRRTHSRWPRWRPARRG